MKDYTVIYTADGENWKHRGFDEADDARNYIFKNHDKWENYYVKKSCVMSMGDFMDGDDNALA